MTTEKRYRCDGCDSIIPVDDVLTFQGSLAHEYAGDDGEPMPCGTVREVSTTQANEGTYKCPRCGKAEPHDHPAFVVRNTAPEGTSIGDTTCPDGTPCLKCAKQPVVDCLCMCHYEF